jgi:hypothetical protein
LATSKLKRVFIQPLSRAHIYSTQGWVGPGRGLTSRTQNQRPADLFYETRQGYQPTQLLYFPHLNIFSTFKSRMETEPRTPTLGEHPRSAPSCPASAFETPEGSSLAVGRGCSPHSHPLLFWRARAARHMEVKIREQTTLRSWLNWELTPPCQFNSLNAV